MADTADIYIKGVSKDAKSSLQAVALSLDIPANSLYRAIIEEAALPYSDLLEEVKQRIEEVQNDRRKNLKVKEQKFRNTYGSLKHSQRHGSEKTAESNTWDN